MGEEGGVGWGVQNFLDFGVPNSPHVFIISSQWLLIMFHKLFPTAPHFIPDSLSKVLLLEPIWVHKRGENINYYYYFGTVCSDFIFWVMRQSKKTITQKK